MFLIKAICFLTVVTAWAKASPSGRVSGGSDITEVYDGNWDGSFQRLPMFGEIYANHICDVSILGEYWVVTLASCLEGLEYPLRYYVVCTNTLIYNYDCADHVIKRLVPHPDYNPVTGDNNIALIEVEEAIFLSFYYAGIVTLPGQNSDPMPGTPMVLYGHGARGENGLHNNHLQKTNVVVSDRTECSEIYPGKVTNNHLCAVSVKAGSGACTGDEGGSLIYNRVLYGMVHYGKKCGDLNYPYIYIRMGMYRKWINEISGL